jgi:hypothetical protein
MTSKIPASAKNTFALIREIIDMGTIDIPEQFNGAGMPGNTLEYLLNVNQNNFDSPDYKDWEIKFHGGGSLLTLFHKEAQPVGMMDKFVDSFGWDGKDGQISFRHTISQSSKRGFVIENADDKIIVKNIQHHQKLVAYWDHNVILNSLSSKLRRLIVVSGKVSRIKRQVTYLSAVAYWEPNLLGFCEAINEGIIYIDFDARTTKGRGSSIRNHGTKFRVKVKHIHLLYENSKIIK